MNVVTTTHYGTVLRSTGSWYEVELDNGEMWSCRTKGKFRLAGLVTTNPIAVGDRRTSGCRRRR